MEKLGGLLISQEDPDVREFVNALSESKLFTDDEIGKASVHYDNLTGMKNPIVYISRGRPWIMGLVGRQSNLPQTIQYLCKTLFTENGWPIDERTQKIRTVFTDTVIEGYNRNYSKHQSLVAKGRGAAKNYIIGKALNYFVVLPGAIIIVLIGLTVFNYLTGKTPTFDVWASLVAILNSK